MSDYLFAPCVKSPHCCSKNKMKDYLFTSRVKRCLLLLGSVFPVVAKETVEAEFFMYRNGPALCLPVCHTSYEYEAFFKGFSKAYPQVTIPVYVFSKSPVSFYGCRWNFVSVYFCFSTVLGF